MPTFKYEIDGHRFESDHPLSQAEAKTIKEKLAPPLSQAQRAGDPSSQIAGVDLKQGAATAVGVGIPLVATALGAVSPIPGGAAIGGALGGAVGESLRERIEGQPQSPGQILTQGALGATAPLASTPVRAAGYGLVSVTLDSLSKGQGLPSIGQAALGILFGGVSGKIANKLTLRSTLKEVLPPEVADEAHEVMTKGRTTGVASPAISDDLREVREAQRQMAFPFSKTPAPEVDVSNVSTAEPPLYTPRGARGRFLKPTSSATQTSFEGFPPTPGQPKRMRLRLGTREHIDPVELHSIREGDTGFKGPVDAGSAGPPADEGPRIGDVRGRTAATAYFARPARLFDKLQTQTGLPLYDEVYKPLHDNLHDYEALKGITAKINDKYLRDPNVPETVKNAVRHLTTVARAANDGTATDLAYAVKRLVKRIPAIGREIDDQTAQRWANNIITAPQASLLPFRVGPALRVFSHTVQTGYMNLGGRWLGRGVARAMTSAGMQEAKRLGALEAAAVPEEIETQGIYGKLLDWGFSGFRYSQDKSRAIMFWGQYEKSLDAARRAGGNVGKFIDRSWLDMGIPRAEAAQIAGLYQQGQVQEAIRRAGIARADSSIPLHSRIDRPAFTTASTLGKVAGALYNWPNFYGGLLRETFLTGEGPAQKKAIAFARWALANTFLAGVATELYQRSGTKDAATRAKEFTFLGPVFYEGGPAIRSVQNVVEGAKKVYTGQKGGFKQMSRGAEPLVPYSYAIEDLMYWGKTIKKTLEDR